VGTCEDGHACGGAQRRLGQGQAPGRPRRSAQVTRARERQWVGGELLLQLPPHVGVPRDRQAASVARTCWRARAVAGQPSACQAALRAIDVPWRTTRVRLQRSLPTPVYICQCGMRPPPYGAGWSTNLLAGPAGAAPGGRCRGGPLRGCFALGPHTLGPAGHALGPCALCVLFAFSAIVGEVGIRLGLACALGGPSCCCSRGHAHPGRLQRGRPCVLKSPHAALRHPLVESASGLT
jgi:hypothetical protein